MPRPNLKPTVCNICGGKVVFVNFKAHTSKAKRGSRPKYLCTKCGAYVFTHKNNPHLALGLLANFSMRQLRAECHKYFDRKWEDHDDRIIAYALLAEKMNIPLEECHFGYMTHEQLVQALEILRNEDGIYRVLNGLDRSEPSGKKL